MSRYKSISLSLLAAMALLFLTGCEQIEQAKNDTIENAKQTALKAIEDVTAISSIEEAKESASQILTETKKATAGLLDQASKHLDPDAQENKSDSSSDLLSSDIISEEAPAKSI